MRPEAEQMANGLVLVVEDEVRIARQARDYLVKSGFRVLVAGDGTTALAMAGSGDPRP